MSLFTTIQNALVDLLQPLDADQPGGYLRRREAFNGRNIEEIIGALQLSAPAVVVSFGEANIESAAFQKRDDVTFKYSLWCADLNLRGQRAAASGSGVSGEGPGAFRIAQDVISAIRHKRIDAGGRDSLNIIFNRAEWIPAKGGLAILRLDAAVTLPQIDWTN